MTDGQVDRFVVVLSRDIKQGLYYPRYVDFLSTICSYGGTPVPMNQNRITKMLLNDQAVCSLVLLGMRWDSDRLVLKSLGNPLLPEAIRLDTQPFDDEKADIVFAADTAVLKQDELQMR